LARKQASRLGYNGNEEVKAHPWFKDFDWEALNDYKIQAPYIPDQNLENFDQNHVNN
jgi:serine/threonine kinase 32